MRAHNDDNDGVGDGAVRTGAQLYHYLCERNTAQCATATRRLREYTTLQQTLQTLPLRSRRGVMAPVAGGLAYYDAELTSTNNLLVLLGDGWFVERSAAQASEIASRRVSFLQRELHVLRNEAQMLEQRRALFMSEMLPEEEDIDGGAVSLSRQQQQGRQQQQQQAKTVTTTTTATGRAAAATNDTAVCDATTTTTTAAPHHHTDKSDDDDDDMAALATFDEDDALTEDELIALERELGDRVDDDALVERLMTERMIAKKEKRVQATLAARRAAAAAAATRSTTRAAGADDPDTTPSFRTPADIGHTAATATTTTTVATTSSPTTTEEQRSAAASSSAATSIRRVHFAPDVVDDNDTADGRVAALSSLPAPTRRSVATVVVGDVVERSADDNSNSGRDTAATAVEAATVATAARRTAPARRSLFAQQQQQGQQRH